MGDVELIEELLVFVLLLRLREMRRLEDGHDVFLDRELAEDGRLLREIADAERRALVHRQFADVHIREEYLAGRRVLESHDHVERRRLARAVRPEQPHDLPLLHAQGDTVHDRALLEYLHKIFRFDVQRNPPSRQGKRPPIMAAALPGRRTAAARRCLHSVIVP